MIAAAVISTPLSTDGIEGNPLKPLVAAGRSIQERPLLSASDLAIAVQALVPKKEDEDTTTKVAKISKRRSKKLKAKAQRKATKAAQGTDNTQGETGSKRTATAIEPEIISKSGTLKSKLKASGSSAYEKYHHAQTAGDMPDTDLEVFKDSAMAWGRSVLEETGDWGQVNAELRKVILEDVGGATYEKYLSVLYEVLENLVLLHEVTSIVDQDSPEPVAKMEREQEDAIKVTRSYRAVTGAKRGKVAPHRATVLSTPSLEQEYERITPITTKSGQPMATFFHTSFQEMRENVEPVMIGGVKVGTNVVTRMTHIFTERSRKVTEHRALHRQYHSRRAAGDYNIAEEKASQVNHVLPVTQPEADLPFAEDVVEGIIIPDVDTSMEAANDLVMLTQDLVDEVTSSSADDRVADTETSSTLVGPNEMFTREELADETSSTLFDELWEKKSRNQDHAEAIHMDAVMTLASERKAIAATYNTTARALILNATDVLVEESERLKVVHHVGLPASERNRLDAWYADHVDPYTDALLNVDTTYNEKVSTLIAITVYGKSCGTKRTPQLTEQWRPDYTSSSNEQQTDRDTHDVTSGVTSNDASFVGPLTPTAPNSNVIQLNDYRGAMDKQHAPP